MTRYFLLGLAAGTGVGFLVGLLMAPGSGLDTRRRISDASLPARAKVSDFAAGVKWKARGKVDVIRQSI